MKPVTIVSTPIARVARIVATWAVAAGLLLSAADGRAQSALPLDAIRLPPGFTIEVLARVPSARAMTWGAAGTLFVGSTEGKVYAVTLPAAGAGGDARVQVIASGLREPAGVAFRDRALYVSAISRILRFDDIERRLADPPPPVVVTDRLPGDGHHGRKFIAFGPDGKLYVNVGVPCNVCEADPDRYGIIARMNPDGSGLEVFARGLRNSVGFDWDPRTKELWFTDNGRDKLGDDVPPGHAQPRAARRTAFRLSLLPRRHDPGPGVRPQAPVLGVRRARAEARSARRRARHALLHREPVSGGVPQSGVHRRARQLEPQREDRLSRDDGDARRRQGGALRAFRRRLAAGESAWGRPADVLVAPDGSLLVSDDTAGAIYRIRYKGP